MLPVGLKVLSKMTAVFQSVNATSEDSCRKGLRVQLSLKNRSQLLVTSTNSCSGSTGFINL